MTAQTLSASVVTTEVLLQVFDVPVSFHRCLIPLTGGVTAALMLSHAMGITQALDPADDGWFVKSREQWHEETGLSRWEWETARRALRDAGFLDERRAGLPARIWYRVRADQVWLALQHEACRAVLLTRSVDVHEAAE